MQSTSTSSKRKPVSASDEPYLPLPPGIRSAPLHPSHVDLLSKATVILCTREDLNLFLTTPSAQHGSACRVMETVSRSANRPPGCLTTIIEDEDEEDDKGMSDTASSHSSLASHLSDKIPKPDGEPGRPGRGGYNLESQLAWDSTLFSRLKKFVYRSMGKHLDTTKSKSRQNNKAVQSVILEARAAFPDLNDYAACWPVHDLIKMHLKYTSRRARESQRMKAGNMEGKKRQPTLA